MFLVLAIAALIWFLGARMGVAKRTRGLSLLLLYLLVLGIQAVLPDGTPLRTLTGGSAALWLMLGGAALIVALYRLGLDHLHARARPAQIEPSSHTGPFSDAELDRYARHIVLRELGGVGQKRLKDARVLVIGAGGLGSPVLLYLAGAGVGTIGVIDDDTVSLSNLARQVIHTDANSGMPKVFSAEKAMKDLNPHVTVKPYNRRLTPQVAEELFAEYDLVVDGTDNFETRYLVNRACVATGTPLLSGAISQWEGQVSLFDPRRDAPCYACVFPTPPAPDLVPSCAEGGVAGPLPGVIGTLMALEAVKDIGGAGETLLGRLLIFDGLTGETRIMKLRRDPACAICKGV